MDKKNMNRSSLSNPEAVFVTHLDWQVQVDFNSQRIHGTASYSFKRAVPSANTLCLDTAHLDISAVKDDTGRSIWYKLHPITKPHLGQKLEVTLSSTARRVVIFYSTTAQCSAAQWLPPAQTAGRVHPYLFTQCQAIHCRSLVPCQDLPGVKMTYNATVTVPEWATCVMSAVSSKNSLESNGQKTYCFEQKVPISSYLFALAVGDLTKADISERCAVWSEPSVVQAAAYEFAQTETFLKTAEDLAGLPYAWGRYDILCLPPSFPYGGMENPCLTFVTPTLLAGDRSLANVIAHEIAHSWTGNLVTNRTWDHFWLNEGWTTWFERKIGARTHKDDKVLDFEAIGGYRSLQDTVKKMPDHATKLIIPMEDNDPDDVYSIVAYEKGFNLLYSLERRVGKQAFEQFFQAYVAHFASKTVTSEEFREFFNNHFNGNNSIRDVDWETWFHSPGMPPETPSFDRSLAEEAENLASVWYAVDQNGRRLPDKRIENWASNKIVCFLNALRALCAEKPLKPTTLAAMNKMYRFADSHNSEILWRYCELAIAAEDQSILPVTVRFITTQGRMKFVRPLYKSLYKSRMGRTLAVKTFLDHKEFYHPICAKLIASDLRDGIESHKEEQGGNGQLYLAAATGLAVAVAILFALAKRR